jgi:repressor LexA
MGTNDLTTNEFKGLSYICAAILDRGRTPTLQAISDHVGFKSRRAASLLIDRLIKKGYVGRTQLGNLRVLKDMPGASPMERTIDIPLVGTAPCGLPLLAEENIEAMVSVSRRLARPGADYFLLRATGNSMNQAGIQDGDLVLVRQQPVAQNGERVVALLDDEATIKEFRRAGDKIMLVPRSDDASHQRIILNQDFIVQGVIVDTIPKPSA